MGSFPETYNDRKRTDETNANKFYSVCEVTSLKRVLNSILITFLPGHTVGPFSGPSRSIHLGDVSEANVFAGTT